MKTTEFWIQARASGRWGDMSMHATEDEAREAFKVREVTTYHKAWRIVRVETKETVVKLSDPT